MNETHTRNDDEKNGSWMRKRANEPKYGEKKISSNQKNWKQTRTKKTWWWWWIQVAGRSNGQEGRRHEQAKVEKKSSNHFVSCVSFVLKLCCCSAALSDWRKWVVKMVSKKGLFIYLFRFIHKRRCFLPFEQWYTLQTHTRCIHVFSQMERMERGAGVERKNEDK